VAHFSVENPAHFRVEIYTQVGKGYDGFPFLGQMAQFQPYAYALTSEEIRQMYRDERPMFHPNSKVTLTGTSSDVKAVAHDKTTGLRHAGTPSGRTVFSGIVPVDQTATPVTTKIIAHDGTVMEQ